ncbi:hypothetical protein F4819DRAFT_504861 [Hypoxylon fuscum]|nr:hypothetical protein F4819DRAFT_504861 [Hypoxylon fuscum]
MLRCIWAHLVPSISLRSLLPSPCGVIVSSNRGQVHSTCCHHGGGVQHPEDYSNLLQEAISLPCFDQATAPPSQLEPFWNCDWAQGLNFAVPSDITLSGRFQSANTVEGAQQPFDLLEDCQYCDFDFKELLGSTSLDVSQYQPGSTTADSDMGFPDFNAQDNYF